jgi:hypothetical protein
VLAPAAPTHQPAPAARRLHPYQLVLLALTALAQVLALAGATAAVVLLPDDAEQPAAAPRPPQTVIAPLTLGKLQRITGPAADKVIEDVLDGQPPYLADLTEYRALYGGRDSGLLLHAVAARYEVDQNTLGQLFFDLRAGGVPVFDLVDVPPGPLGGLAQCGTVRDDGHGIAVVCAWVDQDTRGTIMWYGSTL